MAKSKKNRQPDFQKVKLKVGKKLKKADNVTNASFKTKSILITQQLKTGDTTQPCTKKKQNISELLTQCRHYNASVRHEAITGVRELVKSHVGLLTSHPADILEKCFELLTDKDSAVRQAAIKALKLVLPNLNEKRISPFFPLISAHVCCAMTHIVDDIQIDSLGVLDLMLDYYPKLIISKSNQVLTNFLEQISRQQGQAKDKRSLATNPNSKTSSLKWRGSVLNRLQKVLAAILHHHGNANIDGEVEGCHSSVAWNPVDGTCIQAFPLFVKHSWESTGFTLSSSSLELGPVSEDVAGGRFHDFAATLVPLLIECWVESAPSQKTATGSGSLLRPESVGIMSGVLSVTQMLSQCVHCLLSQEQLEQWNQKQYNKVFQQHFLANFPYSVHDVPDKKGKKDKIVYEKVPAETLNLSVCDIMTDFLPDMPSQRSVQNPIWLSDITQYLVDFLSGFYGDTLIGQSSKTVVKILNKVIVSCGYEDSLQTLLEAVYNRFIGANHLSQEKRVYLQFFTDLAMKDEDTILRLEIKEKFFRSLPELLPLAARESPQMAALLLDTMKRAACQKCSLFLTSELLHNGHWFDPANGAIAYLTPSQQRDLIGIMYNILDLSLDVVKALTVLIRSECLKEEEVRFTIQLLQNRYMRGSQSPDTATIHLAFLCNLVLGMSKEDIESTVQAHGVREITLSAVGQFSIVPQLLEETSEPCTWRRHTFVIEEVAAILHQFGNTDQVVSVMFDFFNKYLTSTKLVPLTTGYGICRFAELVPSIPATISSSILELGISLVYHAVTWKDAANQGLVKSLHDNSCCLVAKIPDGIEKLIIDATAGLKGADQPLLNVLMQTVLLFLSEGRQESIKANQGCLSSLQNFLTTVRLSTTMLNGKKQDTTSLETEKLLTSLEYLTSLLN